MTVGIERTIGFGRYTKTFFTPLNRGREVVLGASYQSVDPAIPTVFDELRKKRKVVTVLGPESVRVYTPQGDRDLDGEGINAAELNSRTMLGRALRARVVNR